MFTPTALQEQRINEVLSTDYKAALIASGMGIGKTLIAVEIVKRLAVTKPVLVVAPISTFIGWERTFKKQAIGIPVKCIDTTKNGPVNYEAIQNGEPGIYIIGHAMFRRKEWKKVPLSVLVYDEVHDVSNRKSLGHRTLMTTKAEWKIAMSGTPGGNKFIGLWAVTRWLWPKQIERSFWRWAAEFSVVRFDPFAGKVAEGEREAGEFVKTLPCYIRDNLELDAEYQEEIRYVELTATQRKMYTQMEKDMLMFLENNVHVAALPITQRVRLRQVTLGVPYVKGMIEKKDADGNIALVQDIDFKEDTKSSKIDALKEIMAENEGENFLVLLDSARFAAVVAARLGDSARLWSGSVPQEEREELLRTFGKEFRTLVATIPSIGTGTDGLQHVCNHVVWLSRSENRLLNEQSVGRLLRTGQTKHVKSWDIQAADTYDSGIFQNLELQSINMKRSLGDD